MKLQDVSLEQVAQECARLIKSHPLEKRLAYPAPTGVRAWQAVLDWRFIVADSASFEDLSLRYLSHACSRLAFNIREDGLRDFIDPRKHDRAFSYEQQGMSALAQDGDLIVLVSEKAGVCRIDICGTAFEERQVSVTMPDFSQENHER